MAVFRRPDMIRILKRPSRFLCDSEFEQGQGSSAGNRGPRSIEVLVGNAVPPGMWLEFLRRDLQQFEAT
jgi:hypothetical protein